MFMIVVVDNLFMGIYYVDIGIDDVYGMCYDILCYFGIKMLVSYKFFVMYGLV